MPKKVAGFFATLTEEQKRAALDHRGQELVGPVPVLFANGALYGYCPLCGQPGELRNARTGKDRCQRKHTYLSIEATLRPGVGEQPAAKITRKRR